MNKHRAADKPWGKIKLDASLQTQFAISSIFIILLIAFLWSLDRYWQNTLEPRLYKVAETQATILAESQAAVLLNTLEQTDSNHLQQALSDTVQKMLIVEDPAIGERFIRHISLQLDYSTTDAIQGSLDVQEGQTDCSDCFHANVPLINRHGEILGLADFAISNGYFKTLSQDMQYKLFAESSIIIVLMIAVWIVMTVMFHRLHTAKKLVEASDQSKTRFMANVTHELRTPLNAILGYTQLYKQDASLMHHHQQGIETIDRSADHLLLMINDILEFSRANEESLTLHPSEVSLAKFLEVLVEMTLVSTRLKGLDFVYKFSPDLPAIIITDEKRLRQILLNLLSNAVKFTESGQVTLTVHKTPSRSGRSAKLHFSVRDSGIGIDKTQLNAIFIPFTQLDNAITRAEGTGLGLTISQRLLKLMGSKLQVDSELDQGSEFRFLLSTAIVTAETIGITATPQTTTPLSLPDQAWLDQLKEQTKRHNILGIRELIEQLQTSSEHSDFLEQVLPFTRQYRFKQLLVWLEQLEDDRSNRNNS